MSRLEVFTVAEQLAKHLRKEIMRGRWQELMPGRNELATELGFNNKTLEAALQILQKEGLLISQGAGRKRLINRASGAMPQVRLRVAILLLDQVDRANRFVIELYHLLEEAGYIDFYTEKSISDFGADTEGLASFVERTDADAWVVVSGSRPVLEWFSAQPVPAFALFGRRGGLPIASSGPDKLSAVSAATSRLLELGHRRISLICREQRRIPRPGASERAYLRKLMEAGIEVGKFHLPDWEESSEGLQAMLDSLFGTTPPTALIVDEAFLCNAVYFYLSHRGLHIPDDVSLVSTDHDPVFVWCRPSVAHIGWDYRPVIRRVVRWVDNISHGKDDRRQTLTKAEFVEGETMGPAKIKSAQHRKVADTKIV